MTPTKVPLEIGSGGHNASICPEISTPVVITRVCSPMCFHAEILRGRLVDAGQHCRFMKAIEAFSWALFVVCTLSSYRPDGTAGPLTLPPVISMFLLVLALTIRARSHGAGSA